MLIDCPTSTSVSALLGGELRRRNPDPQAVTALGTSDATMAFMFFMEPVLATADEDTWNNVVNVTYAEAEATDRRLAGEGLPLDQRLAYSAAFHAELKRRLAAGHGVTING